MGLGSIFLTPSFIKITPSREWRSLMKDKPWFAMYAIRKVTSVMSARWRMGEEQRRKKKSKQASSPTSTPIRWTILVQEEEKWQGGGHQGEQASQQWGQTLLGAKGNRLQHEEHQEGLDPEREVRSPMDFGEFGDLAKYGYISWGASWWTKSLPSGLVNTVDPNSPSHVR